LHGILALLILDSFLILDLLILLFILGLFLLSRAINKRKFEMARALSADEG